MDLGVIGLAIAGVVVAAFFLLRSGSSSMPLNYDDEEGVFGELEIYVAYGRTKQAIEFMEKAVEAKPENEAFRKKLSELKRGAT